MLDLVGNPEDRFSHNEAHIKVFSHFDFENGILVLIASVNSVSMFSLPW